MIYLSPSAAKEIKRLLSKQQTPNVFFRLQVQAGGCSGLFYDMKFDEAVKPADQVYECSSVPVVVDAQSLNYISSLTLDYSEDLMGGGFRFHNPEALAICSCGNSFSIYSTDSQIS
jgi:iron-sulfur cluster assembly accessory protein